MTEITAGVADFRQHGVIVGKQLLEAVDGLERGEIVALAPAFVAAQHAQSADVLAGTLRAPRAGLHALALGHVAADARAGRPLAVCRDRKSTGLIAHGFGPRDGTGSVASGF